MPTSVPNTMLTTVALWAIVSTFAAAAQTTDESIPRVEIERPTGDYQIAYLTLVTENDDVGPQRLMLSLREGRLTEQVTDVSPAHTPGIRFVYTFAATDIRTGETVRNFETGLQTPLPEQRISWGGLLNMKSGVPVHLVMGDALVQAYGIGDAWPRNRYRESALAVRRGKRRDCSRGGGFRQRPSLLDRIPRGPVGTRPRALGKAPGGSRNLSAPW